MVKIELELGLICQGKLQTCWFHENIRNEDKYTDKDGTELENKAELVWEGQVCTRDVDEYIFVLISMNAIVLEGQLRTGDEMKINLASGKGLVWQITFSDKTAQLWWYEVQALPHWGICEGTLQKGDYPKISLITIICFQHFQCF